MAAKTVLHLLGTVLLLLGGSSYGFAPATLHAADRTSSSSGVSLSSRLSMISSFGAKRDTTTTEQQLPRNVRDAISKCRAAVQQALGQRISRMDIEFPVGTKFGVEQQQKKAAKKTKGDDDGAPALDELQASDRGLARLFVEMFQPLGGEHIAVIFTKESLADKARTNWKGDSGAACRIMSLGRRRTGSGKKKKKNKPMGFAAKMASEVEQGGERFQLPANVELALFVAPTPKDLLVVEEVCSKVGMGTLVVLLNARLSRVASFGSDSAARLFLDEFDPVFHLGAAPQDVAPGCLLHRAFPGKWMIARKPKVGQPKVLVSQEDRPTSEDCRRAYESVDLGELEKGVENVLENVAGWFN